MTRAFDAPTRTASGGRPLTAGVAMLATAVAVTGLLVGGLLTAVGLTGHVFGPWPSPESLNPGLVGAAMLGTSPGLFAVGRAKHWEEARTLLHPLAVVLLGLFTVTLLNARHLYVAEGGPVLSVLFSLGWIFVLGLLCVWAVIALSLQHLVRAEPFTASTEPEPASACVPASAGPKPTPAAIPEPSSIPEPASIPEPSSAPLPGWSKPPLAVLGSSWLGIGTGLLIRPDFWADFVPWHTGRLDAQALGVWALALGVGVLGALAEDDLTRTRPALLALPGTAAAMTVVLACRAAHVEWSSGPALSLIAMVAGLLCAGAGGRVLLTRFPAPHN
ncbi:hypothetical protein [Streptomyces sp. HD]|uniref:hypothetical protein n=1 Tax=Streptomyces sp. HD TaxID=3020892 RepID=UPI00232DA6DC|nr:hypothetical protein [Streptomyces sp. HD]MDC0767403.1 hypothetical protein [Streptomyces sp. HD]